MQLGILYASLAGKTKEVALRIAAQLHLDPAYVYNLRTASPADLRTMPTWIMCVPTYGMGDLDHHTRRFFEQCDAQSFRHTRVLLVVLGDQRYHGKTFAGALARMKDAIETRGGIVNSAWPVSDYTFENSNAIDSRGLFYGLVLDQINQPELTDARIAQWLTMHGLRIMAKECA